MKYLSCLTVSLLLVTAACAQPARTDTLRATLTNPADKTVLVVAHRGDWRNAPENSVQAIRNAIALGVDMVEIDLRQTRDGHLILLHDETLDRTTTGTGRPETWPLDSLRKLVLRNGIGMPSRQRIPTLDEALLTAKGRVLVNLDKGYDYFPAVYAALMRTGTLNQVILKNSRPLRQVMAENGDLLNRVLFMPVVSPGKPGSAQLLAEYQRGLKPVAVEFVFAADSVRLVQTGFAGVVAGGSRVWVNSLWASLNGGHDDERAVDEQHPDAAWGWLLAHGATIIQTDRPRELLAYLRRKGLHP